MKQTVVCNAHMRKLIDPESLNSHINYAVEVLKRYKFDSVAFRGMSGALIAPAVAMRMNKRMLMVRKSTACNQHHEHHIEGDQATKRYIIVDDFMCSGQTGTAIKDALLEFVPWAKCIGLLEVTRIDLTELPNIPLKTVYSTAELKKKGWTQ